MAESIVSKKKELSLCFDKLNKLCKKIEQCMLNTDVEIIENYLNQLSDTYQEYFIIYQDLRLDLEPDHLRAFEEKYRSVTANYSELQERARQWWLQVNLESQSCKSSVSQVSNRSSIMRKKKLAEIELENSKKLFQQELEEKELELQVIKSRYNRELLEKSHHLAKINIEKECIESINENELATGDHIFKNIKDNYLQKNNKNILVSDPEDCCMSNPLKAQGKSVLMEQTQPTESRSEALVNEKSLESVLGQVLACGDLPKIHLMSFEGNPLDYTKFIHNFTVNIHTRNISNSLKLQYLLSHCQGKALNCIEPYMYYEPDEGYDLALKTLKDRFGMKHVVGRAHLENLINGKPIKNYDIELLEDLVSELNKCKVILNTIGMENQLNNYENMIKIIQRLPHQMKTKWIDRAFSITENFGREANFCELVEFITNYIKKYKTLFGTELIKDEKQENIRTNKIHTICATIGQNHNCLCCNLKCEKLESCAKFKGMSQYDRFSFVKEHKLCNNCLRPNHYARNCSEQKNCKVTHCPHKHNYLLHQWENRSSTYPTTSYRTYNRSQNNSINTSNPQFIDYKNSDIYHNEQVSNIHCASVNFTRKKIAMSIVPVRVLGDNGKYKDTYGLMDSGSDTTICSSRLLKELNITGKLKSFSITTVNQQKQNQSGLEVNLNIKSIQGGPVFNLSKVWSVPKLPVSLQGLPNQKELNHWPHLKDLEIPKVDSSEVDLLIGSDYSFLLIHNKTIIGKQNEPVAVQYPLGWAVLGNIHEDKTNNRNCNVNFQQFSNTENIDNEMLSQQIERLWTTDFNDLKVNHNTPMSVVDKYALKKVENSIAIKNDRYVLALPWKQTNPQLENNISMAYARLKMLKKKLERDPEMFEKYKTTINDYISKNHARKLTPSEISNNSEKTYYLPHHPVTNINKPGKVRVVFDCAARYNGSSLNDKLLSGPDLVNSLVGVLMRFRQEKIAIAADIEGMFHQVLVQPDDSNALRFLWWKGGDLAGELEHYCMDVHLFGATSSPFCATYALKRTAIDQAENYLKLTSKAVDRNFYVDDLLLSLNNESESITLISELTSMLSNRGFRLTKWISNDRNVLNSVPESEKSPNLSSREFDDLPYERALGIRWNVETDSLEFHVQIQKKPETRRGILSIIASLFDPLGLISPVSLKGKIILQQLSRLRLGWDDPIPDYERQKWRDWLNVLPSLKEVSIPRCVRLFTSTTPVQHDVHIFSDASTVGYGACAYLRIINEDSTVSISLLLGKSRLAPIKEVSIPRLELSGAVVACRLKEMIETELEIKINSYTYWVDSMIVLGYIRNTTKRFKTYVANRLSYIQEHSDAHEWRHIPGVLNPADRSSRGLDPNDAEGIKFWINGPDFLLQHSEHWPEEPDKKTPIAIDECEIKQVHFTTTENESYMSALLHSTNDYHKLIRRLAWIIRYRNFIIMNYSRKQHAVNTSYLTVNELNTAEIEFIKFVQREVYYTDIKKLELGKEVNLDSRLCKLKPVLKNGIIRVGGRLKNSELNYELKYPIILPGTHEFTKKLIYQYHINNAHTGLSTTLTLLREKFWITRGIGAVKNVLHKCISCRRRQARPCSQQMASLPIERLSPDKPPFTYVGIDYFGPLQVKLKRGTDKKYGCIFTCLTTRAIHIEIVESLESDTFISAFRRFTSRRGRPEKVYSDNATNFTGGERELQDSVKKFNSFRVNREFVQRGIEWRFNPPHASHYGGVYERMIRTVRMTLSGITQQQLLTFEQLTTFMCEIERIINSRPITYISSDSDDPEPLTPHHLLLLRANHSLPPGIFQKDATYPVRRWKQVQYLANLFWRRWIREYLPLLQTTHRWQKQHTNIKPGDLLLMAEPNVCRGKWPLAIVTDVHPSSDGLVRSCTIRTGGSQFIRPVTELYMLESATSDGLPEACTSTDDDLSNVVI